MMIAAFLALLTVAVSALGAPTGLNTIPTSELLEKGTLSSEIEIVVSKTLKNISTAFLLQYGLANGIEAGVDFSVERPRLIAVNSKLNLLKESKTTPQVALGFQIIDDLSRNEYYLAMSKKFGEARLHGGILHNEKKVNLAGGFDIQINDKLSLQMDHITGKDSSATFGFVFNFDESHSITAYFCVNTSGSGENYFVFNIAKSLQLK